MAMRLYKRTVGEKKERKNTMRKRDMALKRGDLKTAKACEDKLNGYEDQAPEEELDPLAIMDTEIGRTSNHRIPPEKLVFQNITYADFENAVRTSEGMFTNISRKLGITVYNVKNIMDRYKTLKQDFEEFREAFLDEAETKLREKIQKGDTSSLIFFLKCVGKQRGYIEGQSGVQKKAPVKINIKPADKKGKKKTPAGTGPRPANVVQFRKTGEE